MVAGGAGTLVGAGIGPVGGVGGPDDGCLLITARRFGSSSVVENSVDSPWATVVIFSSGIPSAISSASTASARSQDSRQFKPCGPSTLAKPSTCTSSLEPSSTQLLKKAAMLAA